MRYLLYFLCVFFLAACGNSNFRASGRTPDEIINGEIEESLDDPYKKVAYDYCDCLTAVEWKIFHVNMDEMDEAQQQQLQESWETLVNCSTIQISDKYPGYPGSAEAAASLQIIIQQTCPTMYQSYLGLAETVLEEN